MEEIGALIDVDKDDCITDAEEEQDINNPQQEAEEEEEDEADMGYENDEVLLALETSAAKA
eukprot:4290151-Ditylum_brightwellii.AAC.1